MEAEIIKFFNYNAADVYPSTIDLQYDMIRTFLLAQGNYESGINTQSNWNVYNIVKGLKLSDDIEYSTVRHILLHGDENENEKEEKRGYKMSLLYVILPIIMFLIALYGNVNGNDTQTTTWELDTVAQGGQVGLFSQSQIIDSVGGTTMISCPINTGWPTTQTPMRSGINLMSSYMYLPNIREAAAYYSNCNISYTSKDHIENQFLNRKIYDKLGIGKQAGGWLDTGLIVLSDLFILLNEYVGPPEYVTTVTNNIVSGTIISLDELRNNIYMMKSIIEFINRRGN